MCVYMYVCVLRSLLCHWRSVQYLTCSNEISVTINHYLYFNVQLLDYMLHLINIFLTNAFLNIYILKISISRIRVRRFLHWTDWINHYSFFIISLLGNSCYLMFNLNSVKKQRFYWYFCLVTWNKEIMDIIILDDYLCVYDFIFHLLYFQSELQTFKIVIIIFLVYILSVLLTILRELQKPFLT